MNPLTSQARTQHAQLNMDKGDARTHARICTQLPHALFPGLQLRTSSTGQKETEERLPHVGGSAEIP